MKWIALFVCAPFIAFSFMCIPHIRANRLWQPPPGGYPATWNENGNGQGWSDLITILYWNLSGFDCASTFAGEVVRPGRTYPLALLLALLLAFLTYAIPVVLGVMATDPYDVLNWGTDPGECSWSCIVRNIGGKWLAVWVLVASIVGNMGMYIAEMFEDSWQLYGMAENGMAPAVFAKLHPQYKTPIYGIMFSTILIAALIYFDFSDNLAINNFFSCGSCLLEIFAFIKLRFSKGNLHRPFRIPCGKFTVVFALIVPICLGTVVWISGCMNSYASFMMNMGGLLFGFCFTFMNFCSMKYEYDPRRRRLLSENDTDDSGIENRERLLPEIAEEPVNEKAERRTMEEDTESTGVKNRMVDPFVATRGNRNESSPLLNHTNFTDTRSPAYGTSS